MTLGTILAVGAMGIGVLLVVAVLIAIALAIKENLGAFAMLLLSAGAFLLLLYGLIRFVKWAWA